MSTVLAPPERDHNDTLDADTLEAALARLGNVPAHRIAMHPAPGTATEADVVAAAGRLDKRLYELVDGILVEKAMGFRESLVARLMTKLLGNYVDDHDLGLVAGEGGMMRLPAAQVRIPDVAFVRWESMNAADVRHRPVPRMAPDFAVEVLSESNTVAEMARKRWEYFVSGTRLVWEIDLDARTVAVYTAADVVTVHRGDEVLGIGDLAPGFTVRVEALFATLDNLDRRMSE